MLGLNSLRTSGCAASIRFARSPCGSGLSVCVNAALGAVTATIRSSPLQGDFDIGRTPVSVHRPHLAPGPGDPDPRRGDVGARQPAEEAIQSTLNDVATNRTTIVIAHRLSTVVRRRPDRGPRRRPGGRAWHPCRAAGEGRAIRLTSGLGRRRNGSSKRL